MVPALQPMIEMLTPDKFPFDFAAWPPASLLQSHSEGLKAVTAAATDLKKNPTGKQASTERMHR